MTITTVSDFLEKCGVNFSFAYEFVALIVACMVQL